MWTTSNTYFDSRKDGVLPIDGKGPITGYLSLKRKKTFIFISTRDSSHNVVNNCGLEKEIGYLEISTRNYNKKHNCINEGEKFDFLLQQEIYLFTMFRHVEPNQLSSLYLKYQYI